MASDAQVDSLIEELRELSRTLRSPGGAPNASGSTNAAATFEKSTQKLVLAIGLLASKMDTGIRTRRAENEALVKFSKTIDKTSDDLEKATKEEIERKKRAGKTTEEISEMERKDAQERSAREKKEREDKEKRDREQKRREEANERADRVSRIRELTETKSKSKQYWDDIISSGVTSGDLLKNSLQEKFFGIAGDSMKATAAFELLTAATQGVTKSLIDFASALYKGERGATVTAKAIDSLAKPIIDFSSTLATVGVVVAGIGALGAKIAPAIRILGIAVPQLRVIGLAIASIATLFGWVSKAAVDYNKLASEQTDKLFKSFNALSKAGISSAGGLDNVFKNLQTLGMSMAELDEFNKMIASNVKNLRLFGGTVGDGAKQFSEVAGGLYKSELGRQFEMLGITAEEQRASAMTYMAIQARTGQIQNKNTAELTKGAAAFVRELELTAQLTGQSREEMREARESAMAESRFRSAMIEARERGDTERVKELELYQQLAMQVKSIPGAFEGVLQLGAGRGVPTTRQAEEVGRQFGLLGGGIQQYRGLDATKQNQILAENAKNWQRSTISISAFEGKMEGLTTSIAETDDFILRQQKIAAEAVKMFPELEKTDAIKRFLETEEGRKLADEEMKKMVDATRAQQSAALIMDAGVRTFNGAASISKTASETFAGAVKQFGNIVGAKVAGGTPVGSGAAGGAGAAAPSAAVPGLDMASPEFGGSAGTASGIVSGATQSSMGAAGIPALEKPGQAPQLAKIRELIAGVESKGNYNVLVGGKTAPLTEMTISEVMQLQRQLISQGQGSAAGKYQVIATTLNEAVGKLGLSRDQKFDQATQDQIADFLIRRRGFEQYARNPTEESKRRFLTNLSAEWAGLPAGPHNESYYKGVGNNKSHISWDKAMAAFADGGIVRKPTIGLLAEKPGLEEAIIPLKQGSVPVTLNTEKLISKMMIKQVEMTGTTGEVLQNAISKIAETAQNSGSVQNVEQLTREVANMNDKLAQILDVLGSSKDIQTNLLTYTMG